MIQGPSSTFAGSTLRLLSVTIFAWLCFATVGAASGLCQVLENGYRVGEKLTYNVSFGQLQNVAFAELYTVSRGKLSGRDAIEVRGRLKTLELMGAQIFSVDESRTTFVAPETGLPLFIGRTNFSSASPQETTESFLNSPSSSLDLISLIGKIRDSGGVGTFAFTENDKPYTVTLAPAGSERVKTAAGEFDATVSTVESSYLADSGLTAFKIYLSSDERKIPVLFTFKAKTRRGLFQASLASIDNIVPETDIGPAPTPTPAVVPTPVVIRTPQPTPTPRPYIDNQPLSQDLPFMLGEMLDYKISSGGRTIGTATFSVKERTLFNGKDSLLLTAAIKNAADPTGVLDQRSLMATHVNPETLAPFDSEFHFAGPLAPFGQSAKFDQGVGTVVFGQGKFVEVPVGTQNLLSLLYAVRTFNLKQLKDTNNPLNDTRVAVFWDAKAYILTLRPTNTTIDDAAGRKENCVLVSVSTDQPQLNQLAIKVWLSTDARRLPLRFSVGSYQADLIR